MPTGKVPRAARLAALTLGLGVIGAIACCIEGAAAADQAPQPLRCEIEVDERANGVVLRGVVFAKTAITGSYEFRASQSGAVGDSNVTQSGGFTVGPAAPITIGNITLGGVGGVYVAKLKITWNGTSIECRERSGGTL
jgi:hypothetical protein